MLLHKEDEFVVDTNNGENIAILTQAPADAYANLASAFAALRSSISIT